jgi:hypothetical protein
MTLKKQLAQKNLQQSHKKFKNICKSKTNQAKIYSKPPKLTSQHKPIKMLHEYLILKIQARNFFLYFHKDFSRNFPSCFPTFLILSIHLFYVKNSRVFIMWPIYVNSCWKKIHFWRGIWELKIGIDTTDSRQTRYKIFFIALPYLFMFICRVRFFFISISIFYSCFYFYLKFNWMIGDFSIISSLLRLWGKSFNGWDYFLW